MTKSKRYEIQQSKYKEILEYNPHDFFALKCLVDILEKLGHKTQAKKAYARLAILKQDWIANFKITVNGKGLDRLFKKNADGLVYPQEGQCANWDELWDDLIRSADIDSVEFHFYQSEETSEQCCESSILYLKVAELINDGGDKITEVLFDIAIERYTLDEQLDLCLLILESNPENDKALHFLAKYAFNCLGEYPFDLIIQLLDKVYHEHGGWSDSEILLYRGICYASIENFSKAIKILKKMEKNERSADRRNLVFTKFQKSEKPSDKLKFMISNIIEEIESININ
jgi:tetratricopeptide (TPR) repeat protein